MPLVGGDLCPIAIDVVEKFQIVGDDPTLTEDIDEPEVPVEEEFDSEMHLQTAPSDGSPEETHSVRRTQ